MDKKLFGEWCEEIAARYLESVLGWRVLERRVRFREGEIDLICEVDGELRFVEVKGRRSEKFGSVVEAVTAEKVRRLRRVVARWRLERGEGRAGVLCFLGVFLGADGAVKIYERLIE